MATARSKVLTEDYYKDIDLYEASGQYTYYYSIGSGKTFNITFSCSRIQDPSDYLIIETNAGDRYTLTSGSKTFTNVTSGTSFTISHYLNSGYQNVGFIINAVLKEDPPQPTVYTVKFSGGTATGGSAPSAKAAYSGGSITMPGCGSLYKHSTTYTPFNVYFYCNGGSWSGYSDPRSVTSYKNTYYDYAFTGWSNGKTEGQSYTVTKNETLTAQWSSTGTVTDTDYDSISLLSAPTPPSGYSFAGWYTSASGGSYKGTSGSSYTPTSVTYLYAHWSKNPDPVKTDPGWSVQTGANIPAGETVEIVITNPNGLTINAVAGGAVTCSKSGNVVSITATGAAGNSGTVKLSSAETSTYKSKEVTITVNIVINTSNSKCYIGNENDQAALVGKIYCGVNNEARKIKAVYVGVNGTAKLCFAKVYK